MLSYTSFLPEFTRLCCVSQRLAVVRPNLIVTERCIGFLTVHCKRHGTFAHIRIFNCADLVLLNLLILRFYIQSPNRWLNVDYDTPTRDDVISNRWRHFLISGSRFGILEDIGVWHIKSKVIEGRLRFLHTRWRHIKSDDVTSGIQLPLLEFYIT